MFSPIPFRALHVQVTLNIGYKEKQRQLNSLLGSIVRPMNG